ncbi:hypothetical protein HID58_076153 [Brassica napus]|uniref:Uncharacterized protein n=2 Tax=Brassica TaxID=3705 RepID=A0ABQ7YLW4_BRANA|nr:hypothetical protein HID58_076153 [Brassica napus]VDD37782.1 unnamed protein product [Brassica oleracea]
MNHLSHHHLRHRSSRPSSSQASIVSGVVHLRCNNLRHLSSLESELSKKLEITENAKEENDEEEEGSKAETSTTNKKKNKNKSKKKPQQTDPPTIPIVKFFPSGDFPEGEIQQYKDE